MYSEKVMEHFHNPRNMGKMENPDGVGEVGNIICGDIMRLYIKVGKNQKEEIIIKDIQYQTFGCVAAISTSSMITELAKGKTISEAMNIDKDIIIESLKGLPKIKHHCSVLATDALAEAIYDYLLRQKKIIPLMLEKRHKKVLKEKEELRRRHAK